MSNPCKHCGGDLETVTAHVIRLQCRQCRSAFCSPTALLPCAATVIESDLNILSMAVAVAWAQWLRLDSDSAYSAWMAAVAEFHSARNRA